MHNRPESRSGCHRKSSQELIHELSGYCTENDDHKSESEHKNALRNEVYANFNVVCADMKGTCS